MVKFLHTATESLLALSARFQYRTATDEYKEARREFLRTGSILVGWWEKIQDRRPQDQGQIRDDEINLAPAGVVEEQMVEVTKALDGTSERLEEMRTLLNDMEKANELEGFEDMKLRLDAIHLDPRQVKSSLTPDEMGDILRAMTTVDMTSSSAPDERPLSGLGEKGPRLAQLYEDANSARTRLRHQPYEVLEQLQNHYNSPFSRFGLLGLYALCSVPAIGGFVVVGQMLQAYGVCVRIA